MAAFNILSINSQKGSSRPMAGLGQILGLSTLSYPSDLGTDNTKKHYVVFQVKEITPQTFEVGTGAAALAGQAYTGTKNYLQSTIAKATGSSTEGVTANQDTGAEKAAVGTLNAVVQGINESINIKKNRTSVQSYIALYMPDTLQASYKADYASISLRDQLGSLNAIRAVGSIAATGLDAIGDDKDVLNAIGSDPNAIKWAIDSFANTFKGGQDLSSGILQTQGYTSNPQLQMIYQGAPFRTFTLNFVFTPKSKEEAKEVEKIIHQFKYYAAPMLQTPGSSPSSSMFLTPPALFEVRFFYDGKENSKLPKYTDCVLEDIQLDYAPNGWAAHTDGAPLQTHLSLSFHEVEIVDKARLDLGYNNQEGGLR